MATPIRLSLSQRQAAALAEMLDEFVTGNPDTAAALREVAEKLGTLRED